jgi:hypothetical protein
MLVVVYAVSIIFLICTRSLSFFSNLPPGILESRHPGGTGREHYNRNKGNKHTNMVYDSGVCANATVSG